MKTKRCPLHPDGCTKHPNPNKGKPGRPGNPARRHQPSVLRGSLVRYVALDDPHGRRLIDRRTGASRWIRRPRPADVPECRCGMSPCMCHRLAREVTR